MILKSVVLFLVGMMVLGMFGKLRRKSRDPDPDRRIETAQKCKTCGNFVIGRSPQPCSRPDCPQG